MAIKKEKTKLKMNKPRYLDLKVIIIMYVLNKSTRLCLVVMMIKDCKHLIKLKHPYGTNVFKVCESNMLGKI